ncbi:MAG: HAD family hydrolase [Acidimicrobiales bacterium]
MPQATANQPIEAVLFDMGGVLVELGPLDQLLDVDTVAAEDFWPRWLTSPAVRAFETGRCNVGRFAEDLVVELELDLSAQEVIDRVAAFPRGLYPGAVELVESVSSEVAMGLLSNTNQLHWEHQQDNEVIRGLFENQYVSYQLGLLKPDREIFDHVVADLGVDADRVLFIDDNQMNVDGAIAAGLRSRVAKGPAATAAILADYDLISSG